MTINVAMGGRARQRALLVFVVLAGLFAMHGFTAGHDPLMPGGHQPARAMTVLTAAPLQPMGAAAAGVAVVGDATAAVMDVGVGVSMVTNSPAGRTAATGVPAGSSAVPVTVTAWVAAHVNGLPMAAMGVGAACIAILTGALALVLLALALAGSRSRRGSVRGYRDRARRWPTDVGPPRRTSLTLVQLSISRT